MKTLMTAALLAALATAGFAGAQEGGKASGAAPKTEAPKSAGKSITVDELGQMLEAMGYEAKPAKTEKGEVVGYTITIEHEGWTLYCTVEVSQNGKLIWLCGTFAPIVDKSTPVEVFMAMLEANNTISPAAINYLPKSKKFQVMLTLPNAHMTAASLRVALNQYAAGMKQTVTTYNKVTAALKEKADEIGVGTTKP